MATLHTPSSPPAKGVAFAVQIALQDLANPGAFKASATIASGDFKVSIDGGALANLTVLPSVEPAASIWVNLQLSASEMDGDQIAVQCIDQTVPAEWAAFAFCIETSP